MNEALREMREVPLLDLTLEYEYMKKDIDQALERCLLHQKWILGPEVKELEEAIADYVGARHCIGVSSGTEALVLALRAHAIKTTGKEYFDRDDEIITTPFTFTATGDAILRAGATPVFIDIEPESFNIDADKVREYVESGHSKVKGIIPVHLYGKPCEMHEILSIAREHGLFVLEDAAQAFGGMYARRKLGSLGHAGAFSFFPSKNLGGFGDGGMVAVDDPETASLVRMLMKHGGRDKYNVDHIAYNARLDTIQAAVLLAKLKYVDEFNALRRNAASFYQAGLDGMEQVSLPGPDPEDYHVYHQYTIRVKNGERDGLQRYLVENGISTMVYYPVPLHKMKVFEGRCRMPEPPVHSERAVEEVLSLPIEPLMKRTDAEYVVERIRSFFLKG